MSNLLLLSIVLLHFQITTEHVALVEKETRGQSAQKARFTFRSGRLTASIIKSAVRTNHEMPSQSLIKGALAYRVSIFLKYFVFASLCSFICLQAVYQLSGPVCKATWNGCPSYSASYFHFTLCD